MATKKDKPATKTAKASKPAAKKGATAKAAAPKKTTAKKTTVKKAPAKKAPAKKPAAKAVKKPASKKKMTTTAKPAVNKATSGSDVASGGKPTKYFVVRYYQGGGHTAHPFNTKAEACDYASSLAEDFRKEIEQLAQAPDENPGASSESLFACEYYDTDFDGNPVTDDLEIVRSNEYSRETLEHYSV